VIPDAPNASTNGNPKSDVGTALNVATAGAGLTWSR